MLSGRHFLAIFSRDQLTADDLSEQLARPVQFLGNPFMDPVLTAKKPLAKAQQPMAKAQHRIGLLPGSRLPELEANLQLLLKMSAQLPDNMGISLKTAAMINKLIAGVNRGCHSC